MISRIFILVFLFATNAFGALTASDRQFTQPPLETLLNPGFEFGKSNWLSSGGSTATVTSGSNLLEGLTSLTWDSSGAAQTLCSSTVTIPEGAKGRPGIGALVMKVPSGTSTHVLQVRDGSANVLATSGSRSYAGGSSDSQRINTGVFSFPSSGTIRLCLVSVAADEPLVALDSGTLRTDPWNLVASQTASLVASGVFPQTANCSWDNSTTGSLVAFTADTDCPGPTLITNDGPGTLDLTDTNLPQFTINNLPPGTCEVQFLGGVSNSGANNNTLAISDGTNTRNPFVISQDTAGNVAPFNARATFTYASAGNRTFSLFGRAGGGTTNIPMGTGFTNATPSLSFSIWCSPLQANQALRADQVGWKVDANISGANPSLGTSSVTSYTGIENGSLTMTQNAGSAPVQIGCSGTNAPTGLTCSSGNESVSVAFTPPVAGDYLACASFSHYAGFSTSGQTVVPIFQIIETPTNAQTISQQGKTRILSGFTSQTASGQDFVAPFRVCGNFNFTSTSQKMLRLMYEQFIGGTAPNASQIQADADAARGQQDIHWEVYPVNPWIQAPVIVNSMVTGYNGVAKNIKAEINCDAASAITSQSGGISAVGNRATAACALTLTTGFFSSTPWSCNVTTKAATVQATACSCSSATACTIYGASADYDAYVSIAGPQ